MSSKITTFDWDTANKANFKLADKEKGLAEQLRNDAWRAVKATDRETRVRQAANTKRLGQHSNHHHVNRPAVCRHGCHFGLTGVMVLCLTRHRIVISDTFFPPNLLACPRLNPTQQKQAI